MLGHSNVLTWKAFIFIAGIKGCVRAKSGGGGGRAGWGRGLEIEAGFLKV